MTLPALQSEIPGWLEDADNGLSERVRALLQGLWRDLQRLTQPIAEMDKLMSLLADENAITQRLQQLRGVGPLVDTALVATVGTGQQ